VFEVAFFVLEVKIIDLIFNELEKSLDKCIAILKTFYTFVSLSVKHLKHEHHDTDNHIRNQKVGSGKNPINAIRRLHSPEN
jgi:hypothetical protein